MRFRSHMILPAAMLVSLLTGCVCEDPPPPCPIRHELYISIADGDVSPDIQVDTATVFVFDDRDVLQDVIHIDLETLVNGKPVYIPYRCAIHPRVVVWGNLDHSVTTTPVLGETSLDDLRVTMSNDGEYAGIPDNLYYTTRILTAEPVQYVDLEPAMGRLSITTRGLDNDASGSYFFVIETQIGGYDFLRTPVPENEAIRVDAVRNETTGDLTSGEALPMFVYPVDHDSLKSVKLSLYRQEADGNHLIGETDIDNKLLEIIPHPGECENILMDFRGAGDISIHIRVTDWDVVEQWKDW